MFFSRIALFALPAIAAASAIPRDSINSCNIGNAQLCCNTLQNANQLSDGNKALFALGGFQTDNVLGQFGVTCNPISGAGAGAGGAASFNSAGCNTQNVCCEKSTANGFLGVNCSPATVNGR